MAVFAPRRARKWQPYGDVKVLYCLCYSFSALRFQAVDSVYLLTLAGKNVKR